MSDYKVLHTSADEFGDIFVLDDGHFRVLSFGDNDEQSKMDKTEPFVPQHTYVQAMLCVLMAKQPKSVVILGLGGGALVHALRHYDAAIKITAVELREQVIHAAKRFFQLPVGKKLNVVHQNANHFLKAGDFKKCDMLFVDIYSEKGVDPTLLSAEFTEHCYLGLKADGILVLNCWKEHRNNTALLSHLQMHFSHIHACLTGGGNWVVFATNQSQGLAAMSNKANQQTLSQALDINIPRVLTRFEPWQ
ncbi:spermidine synthase [Shewanella glacialimarina]|jgi:spermidine synthase|uniref:spermidine synthase n=1 Tax=Shewanella glacialimarina TaxID=2590884 RepID=UPI001CF82848|nr:fused MFS/spermidine synthase [Shewanella glacialimarina]UCX03522.1 spermidine synthase [Shewanella glacialimarina]